MSNGEAGPPPSTLFEFELKVEKAEDYTSGNLGITQRKASAVFQQTLVIKGSAKDLDAIYNTLNFPPDSGQIIRCGDPSDVTPTKEQMAELLGGKPLFYGTTRLEIRFNGDKEDLKGSILKKFPKVSIE